MRDVYKLDIFPGQFSCEAIDRIRTRAPLARLVGLLGSWCEGEVRSGQPWPGTIRIYAHQWPGRAEQELKRLEQEGVIRLGYRRITLLQFRPPRDGD